MLNWLISLTNYLRSGAFPPRFVAREWSYCHGAASLSGQPSGDEFLPRVQRGLKVDWKEKSLLESVWLPPGVLQSRCGHDTPGPGLMVTCPVPTFVSQ